MNPRGLLKIYALALFSECVSCQFSTNSASAEAPVSSFSEFIISVPFRGMKRTSLVPARCSNQAFLLLAIVSHSVSVSECRRSPEFEPLPPVIPVVVPYFHFSTDSPILSYFLKPPPQRWGNLESSFHGTGGRLFFCEGADHEVISCVPPL